MWEKKKGARVFGYARVSTDDQDLAMQMLSLEREDCDHIFQEKASGSSMERDVFELMLMVLRRGDRVVVWKLDRLGRTLTGLIETIEMFGKMDVDLVVVTEKIDTTTATGKLFFHIMAALAQWERDMISDRTTAGMAAARAAGKKFGRRPLIWHNDHGSTRRLACLRDMDHAGELRERSEGQWVLIPRAEALMVELNKQKNRTKDDRDIENAETVRRWTRNGWQGLDDTTEPKA